MRPDPALDQPVAAPLADRFVAARRMTEELAAPLSAEDQQVQSMPDVSPTKWHLAHTSWYFEAFVLEPFAPGYAPWDPSWHYLFNSYYEALGARHPRPERGLLTRPRLDEVAAYRGHVEDAVLRLVARLDPERDAEALARVELGLHHEQQHQELILTDIKHVLAQSPLEPAYDPDVPRATAPAAPELRWFDFDPERVEVGFAGDGFAFDNERPRHPVLLRPFRIASRPVTNGEFLAFVESGGYDEPAHWLFAGWSHLQATGWRHPLYWRPNGDGSWREHTLAGPRPLDPAAPVCHVSYYEADAYARWAGRRLPDEAEWEHGAGQQWIAGNLLDDGWLHPRPARGDRALPEQLFGDVWEWTRSPYGPYPGYRPPAGAVGEYNGKFMCNQQVLRGGSCLTPADHIRETYRNFFPPEARWQVTGFRLADDA